MISYKRANIHYIHGRRDGRHSPAKRKIQTTNQDNIRQAARTGKTTTMGHNKRTRTRRTTDRDTDNTNCKEISHATKENAQHGRRAETTPKKPRCRASKKMADGENEGDRGRRRNGILIREQHIPGDAWRKVGVRTVVIETRAHPTQREVEKETKQLRTEKFDSEMPNRRTCS